MPCSEIGREGDRSAHTLARSLAAGRRRGQDHDLLHVRLPLRHQGASEGRPHPLHRGQPRPSGQPGVLCAKGSAGIMQHYSPARLTQAAAARRRARRRRVPRDRVGRGAGDRGRAGSAAIRASDPRKLAFFTGRDQSQALTGWWATQFGTPNYAAHGGFCSVNMAAAGLYTIGGSFWEFGEPDWEHTRYFMMFGVAEDHDSNPIKIGLGKLKASAAPSSSRSIRCAPAIRRSPTNGSASGPAPTGCSCWR